MEICVDDHVICSAPRHPSHGLCVKRRVLLKAKSRYFYVSLFRAWVLVRVRVRVRYSVSEWNWNTF